RPEVRLIAAQIPTAKWVAAFGIFDFDHFRAHIGEQHRAVGAGDKISQLQNSDALQATFHSRSPTTSVFSIVVSLVIDLRRGMCDGLSQITPFSLNSAICCSP